MDRIIYTAATGANRILDAQAAISHNMANISTTGFREQMAAYRAVPVSHEGADPATTPRVLTTAVSAAGLFNEGPTIETGRPLDARIKGSGWFVVRAADGNEAYTRNGHFVRNNMGVLVDNQGREVISADGAPIELGDAVKITFDETGGINTLAQGARARDIQRSAQLKLVDPPLAQLERGEDGLFRVMNANRQAVVQPHNDRLRIMGNALEGSNVSAAESMVKMIQNGRLFEMNMKIITDASANAQAGNSVLSIAS